MSWLAPRRLVLAGAMVTVAGLAVAATAPVVGVGPAARVEVQQGAGGLVVLAGWVLLALGIHRFGRENSLIVSSSEPEELEKLCDRVLCLKHGRIVAELEGDDLTASNIVAHIS